MEMMCAMYPLFRCAIEQPSQCGGGILLGGSGDVPDLTTDELAQLEEMCPSATTTSGTDGDDENDNSSPEEVSSCGSISLAWLSASLPLVVSFLRFEAAR
ncbi:unnamed protein product [Prorocentrum cordatum]|uniref:Uncharacterized protein n=1 Tax=Prorocentrum cordatum TaxID=2364126 RepID=A0ABN9Q4R4_9DINO|nr:unnamed protein product [Polarella glacialis]